MVVRSRAKRAASGVSSNGRSSCLGQSVSGAGEKIGLNC